MHGHKNIPSANPLFSGIIMSSPYSPHQYDKGKVPASWRIYKKSRSSQCFNRQFTETLSRLVTTQSPPDNEGAVILIDDNKAAIFCTRELVGGGSGIREN